MYAEVNCKSFQEALKKLSKAIDSRTSLEVLRCISVETKGNSIILVSTDLNDFVEVTLAGIIYEENKFMLNPETIKLIQKLKGNTIKLSRNSLVCDNKTLEYVCGFYVDDFPTIPIYDFKKVFQTDEQTMLDMLQVSYACSKENVRPIFQSVMIDKEEIVATDTHRLSFKKLPFDNVSDRKIFVSLGTVKLLENYLTKSGKNVKCLVSDNNYVQFQFGNMRVISREIEGTFPNWKQVFPQSFSTEVRVNKDNLKEELEFLKDFRFVSLSSNEGATIKAYCKNDTHRMSVNIPSLNQTGKLDAVSFNINFLIEALKHTDEKEVVLKFAGKFSPLVFNNNLVLPIRTA